LNSKTIQEEMLADKEKENQLRQRKNKKNKNKSNNNNSSLIESENEGTNTNEKSKRKRFKFKGNNSNNNKIVANNRVLFGLTFTAGIVAVAMYALNNTNVVKDPHDIISKMYHLLTY
jgi:hypothetical protein